MIITFVIVRTFGLPHLEVTAQDAIANLTMLQRYIGFAHVDNSYWTLSYELGFYAGMLFLFMLRLQNRANLIIMAFLAFQASVCCLEHLGVMNVPGILVKVLMLTYGHQFVCGIAFYILHTQTKRNIAQLIPWWAIVNEALIPDSWDGNIPPNPALLFCFVIVFYAFIHGYLRWMRMKFLVFLGGISYSLYLVHQHIGYVVMREAYRLGVSPYGAFVCAVVIVFSLATGITYLVEKPSLRKIREWYMFRGRAANHGCEPVLEEAGDRAKVD